MHRLYCDMTRQHLRGKQPLNAIAQSEDGSRTPGTGEIR